MITLFALFYCVYSGGPDSYCDLQQGPFATLAECREAQSPYLPTQDRIQRFECREINLPTWQAVDHAEER